MIGTVGSVASRPLSSVGHAVQPHVPAAVADVQWTAAGLGAGRSSSRVTTDRPSRDACTVVSAAVTAAASSVRPGGAGGEVEADLGGGDRLEPDRPGAAQPRPARRRTLRNPPAPRWTRPAGRPPPPAARRVHHGPVGEPASSTGAGQLAGAKAGVHQAASTYRWPAASGRPPPGRPARPAGPGSPPLSRAPAGRAAVRSAGARPGRAACRSCWCPGAPRRPRRAARRPRPRPARGPARGSGDRPAELAQPQVGGHAQYTQRSAAAIVSGLGPGEPLFLAPAHRDHCVGQRVAERGAQHRAPSNASIASPRCSAAG